MIPLSIASATEVYADVSRCQIERHPVDHPMLGEVSRSIRALVQSLGDEVLDEFWRNTLGPIRRLAFAFCSAPLPFSQAAASAGIAWDKLDRQLHFCKRLFPDSYDALAHLLDKLHLLSTEQESPLIPALEELLRQRDRLSVVMRNPRMNQAVAAYFAANPTLRNAKVVSAGQLRGGHACDVLAAIGPSGWHPPYVFSAPRAPDIHIICFRWIRDAWKPGPVLLHAAEGSKSEFRSHRIGTIPKVSGELSKPSASLSEILPLDLLPPLPPFAQNRLDGAGSQSDGSAETIPARLCLLSGSRAVFVAADEGATCLIIDPSESGRAIVRRVPVNELEPGQFLLLRTSGGGDFIAPLADRIMGASAVKRRSEQARWKQHLVFRATQRFGRVSRRELASEVSSSLRAQKLSEARPDNVYYWMSSKCIRPRKEKE